MVDECLTDLGESAKRLTLPHGRGFHEKAGLCQVKSRLGESLLIRVMPGPTNGRHDTAADQGPLSLMIRCVSSEGRNSVKGGLPAKANP